MLRKLISPRGTPVEVKEGWALFVIVACVGAIYAAYVYSLGLTLFFVDQNSHLNIARQIFDSMTPGISQIGFWPPMLHILMAPFTMVGALFSTGLAGAFVLVPALALAALFVHRLLVLLTGNRTIGIAGMCVFLLNPYLLYYAVTPMTEVLFLSALLGSAYFLALWLKEQDFSSLVYLGIFITVASLSRFEGFVLIPIAAAVIVSALIAQRKRYHEVEAVVILFSLVAGLGVAFTLVYGWIYGGNPIAFMYNEWSAFAQQRSLFLPAEGSAYQSFLYLVHASFHMIGTIQVIVAFASFFLLLLLIRKRRYAVLAVSLMLLSPFLFDWYALYQGTIVIYLPNLPPFEGFFNERYGLYWYGFATIIPMLLAGVLYEIAQKTTRSYIFFGGTVLASTVAGLMIVSSSMFMYEVTYGADRFGVITSTDVIDMSTDQREVARVLASSYDEGKILITRGLQNYVTVEAGLPLRKYIHESNHPYYDQALHYPWYFARWVVMYNPDAVVDQWRRENELISAIWHNSDDFAERYELVFSNRTQRLYRLRSDVVTSEVAAMGVDPARVPSLNHAIHRWDSGFYELMVANAEAIELAQQEAADTQGGDEVVGEDE
jgi:hypothetical protein